MSSVQILCCVLVLLHAVLAQNKEQVREPKQEVNEPLPKEFCLTKEEEAEIKKVSEAQLSQERENETKFSEIDDIVSRRGTPIDQHRQFTFTQRRSVDRGREHRINIIEMTNAINLKNIPIDSIPDVVERGFGPQVFCDDNCTCDINTPYRTADGSCNNLEHTTWGMASIPMRRFLYPDYDDGVSSPRQLSVLSTPGNDVYLPSARNISVEVHEASSSMTRSANYTHMVMQWGQFLDHDITATPSQQLPDNSGTYGGTQAVACCVTAQFVGGGISQNDLNARPQCFPIQILHPDRHFPDTITCMNFIRSVQVENSNCTVAPVEQLNQITAYIDASQVYGSSQEEQNSLRDTMGLLLVKNPADPYPYLPEDPTDLSCTTPNNAPTDYCFRAGDHRVNENPTLQSMHTIFVREHNRIAKALKAMNCHWNDERIFQEARKIVGAIMQKITYGEYLPIVVGSSTMSTYDLNLQAFGYANVYETFTDASIRNVFAAAAFRMGHSMIKTFMSSFSNTYTNLGQDQLHHVFGNTHQILTAPNRDVGHYSRGLAKDCVQEADRFLTTDVTDHLFQTSPFDGMDLAALNIQRGRDHGLPSYLEWRAFCNVGPAVTTFNDLLATHSSDAVTQLENVYSDVEDIDLFPGALSEEPVDGLLGPTFACLLGKQFELLKKGDRFWFEDDNDKVKFTPQQLTELRKATLSRVVCDNTDTISIQPNAFEKGDVVSCSTLPKIDLSKWKESLGSWGAWGPWGKCKNGLQKRTRKCEPCNCGCEGDNAQYQLCSAIEKPCGWTLWGPWGSCNVFTRYRKRVCQCPGSAMQSGRCGLVSYTDLQAARTRS